MSFDSDEGAIEKERSPYRWRFTEFRCGSGSGICTGETNAEVDGHDCPCRTMPTACSIFRAVACRLVLIRPRASKDGA